MFKQQTPDPRPAQYQVALRSGGAGAPFSAVAKGREVNSRLTAIHVSHLSRKKHEFSGRAMESALSFDQGLPLRTCASRLVVPASPQDRTSICCLRLRRAIAED